jgi:hypothetical protein
MSGTRFDRRFLVVCLLLAACGLCAPRARADCPLYRLPTNRFGVDLNSKFGRITDYDVGALHIGWYSDWWSSSAPLRPGGIEYVQLISVHEGEWTVPGGGSWTVPGSLVDASPGAIWMIGNEPECPNDPGGGKMTPAQYGAIYHDLYTFIKGRDPTAKIAIGGVVEPTPLRLEWLDLLLTYYQTTYGVSMPVDIWTTHLLILPEMSALCPVEICGDIKWGAAVPVGLSDTYGRLYGIADNWSVPIFQQLVVEFRTWMSSHGQRNKPLMITEYGVLMPYASTAQVNAYMSGSFDYMLSTSDANLGYPADANLLVQRWLWNSLNDQPYNFETAQGFNGGLFDYTDSTFPGTPTAFGLNFISYTNALLTGAACITGTVSMEARPAAPDASYVTTATLTLLAVGCPQPDVRSVTTNASGRFTVCNVTPGTYDIVAKGYSTLANRTNAVVLPSGSTNVNLGLLRSGDANNDNQVTMADFSILAAAYRTVAGDAAYDQRADFNGDGKVDIRDFSLLATHFSQVGAQAW